MSNRWVDVANLVTIWAAIHSRRRINSFPRFLCSTIKNTNLEVCARCGLFAAILASYQAGKIFDLRLLGLLQSRLDWCWRCRRDDCIPHSIVIIRQNPDGTTFGASINEGFLAVVIRSKIWREVPRKTGYIKALGKDVSRFATILLVWMNPCLHWCFEELIQAARHFSHHQGRHIMISLSQFLYAYHGKSSPCSFLVYMIIDN